MGDLGDMGKTLSYDIVIPYLGKSYEFRTSDIGFKGAVSDDVDSFIQKMEVDYPTLTDEFKRLQIQQYILFLQKHHDYGLHNIDLNEDLSTPEGRIFPTTALIIRIRDKVERLKNIIKKGTSMVGDESLVDTFKDLSVYGIIAQIVQSGKWKRG